MNSISLRSPTNAIHITRMEDIYDQAKASKDIPHRHDYYTVILVGDANGVHHVDTQSYTFGPNQLHFVSPGSIHQVDLKARPHGVVLTFSRSFLIENNISEQFITNINLFKAFDDVPPLDLESGIYHQLKRIVEQMIQLKTSDMRYKSSALGAYLKLLLIYASNCAIVDDQQLDSSNSAICLVRDFKELVNTHFNKWHKVQQYANAVHRTSKHLSETVKEWTGKTAKTMIQDRLILEAKRLFLHTDANVKEVAFKLGFEEPLHFSAFFKKETGMSPSKYKANINI